MNEAWLELANAELLTENPTDPFGTKTSHYAPRE